MRPWISLWFVALPCLGQITGLAVTDDGAQLYFSTPMRVKGTDLPLHAKLYRFNGGTLELFDVRPEERDTTDPLQRFSTFYQAAGASVSGDGTAVAVRWRRTCTGGGRCVFQEYFRSALRRNGSDTADETAGQLLLSRNGRWGVSLEATGQVVRTSFETAVREVLPRFGSVNFYLPQIIAGDGSVVRNLDESGQPRLIVHGTTGSRNFATTKPPFAAAIDDRARTAVYLSEDRVFAVDLATGRETPLGTYHPPERGEAQTTSVWLSNDGQVVLLLDGSPRQIVLARTDGSSRRVLTSEEDGIREAVLSGFGNVVYAVSERGALLKIDVASGLRTEMLGASPNLDRSSDSGAARGSLFTVFGSGLSQAEFWLEDQRLPLIAASARQAAVQIPWAAAADWKLLSVRSAAAPFEAPPLIVTVVDEAPSFLAVAHGDFRGAVTADDPLRPAELVHAFMTGLGPVSPPVADGQAGPVNPLSRTETPVSCAINAFNNPADVLYSGLAPLLVGVYQVSMRLPATLPSGLLCCQVNTGVGCTPLPLAPN